MPFGSIYYSCTEHCLLDQWNVCFPKLADRDFLTGDGSISCTSNGVFVILTGDGSISRCSHGVFVILTGDRSISCGSHSSGGSRISPRGGANSPRGGAPTYYLANFSRKLHENKEILGPRGGARPLRPPLDPPLHRVLVILTGDGSISCCSHGVYVTSTCISGFTTPGLFSRSKYGTDGAERQGVESEWEVECVKAHSHRLKAIFYVYLYFLSRSSKVVHPMHRNRDFQSGYFSHHSIWSLFSKSRDIDELKIFTNAWMRIQSKLTSFEPYGSNWACGQ